MVNSQYKNISFVTCFCFWRTDAWGNRRSRKEPEEGSPLSGRPHQPRLRAFRTEALFLYWCMRPGRVADGLVQCVGKPILHWQRWGQKSSMFLGRTWCGPHRGDLAQQWVQDRMCGPEINIRTILFYVTQ